MNEMPNCPTDMACQCYSDCSVCPCVCGDSEKVLRAWSAGWTQRMTNEQRAWCLDEIDDVEGFSRTDYAGSTDAELARGVLAAWLDYCRDKGLM